MSYLHPILLENSKWMKSISDLSFIFQSESMGSRLSWLDFRYQDPYHGFDRSKVHGVAATLFKIKDINFAVALDTAGGGKVILIIFFDIWFDVALMVNFDRNFAFFGKSERIAVNGWPRISVNAKRRVPWDFGQVSDSFIHEMFYGITIENLIPKAVKCNCFQNHN